MISRPNRRRDDCFLPEGSDTSEARYRRLFEGMLNGFAHCRMRFEGERPQDFIYLKVNQAFEAQTGLTGVTGRWVSEVIPGIHESDPRLFEVYGRVARTGLPERFEMYVEALDDWFDIAVYSPAADEFVAVFDVITKRKRLELDLVQSEARLRALFDSVQQGIICYEADGRILSVNPAAKRILGVHLSETRGLTATSDLWQPIQEDGTPLEPEDFPIMVALRERRPVQEMVLGFPRKEGEGVIWISVSAMPLFRPGNPHPFQVYETFRDITEQKHTKALQQKLEEDIWQAQKLESIGSLASGVAHDMNNVLAAIQAVTETLVMRHHGDGDLQASLETIDRAAGRGRDLVMRLTNFARKDLQKPALVDVNALLREEGHLLRRTTLGRVSLVLDLEEGLPPVLGERGHLGSALMNLCVNSVYAMPHGGTLTLRTRALKDGQLELEVTDTGEGMSDEVLARATDPFFTTKPFGKGTGIGLAAVNATVKAHRGSLTIQSALGKGTTVLIRLPVCFDPNLQATKPPGPCQSATIPRRILFVDDDELILASVPGMLESVGHTVTPAAGGLEALGLLEEGLAVDLVILDLNMPGMDGTETLSAIRKKWIRLPVLLVTGYQTRESHDLVDQDAWSFAMLKPFSSNDLEEQLSRIFATPPEA